MLDRKPYPDRQKTERPKSDWIAGLCSCILHLATLLVLAAWSMGLGTGNRGGSLTIESGDAEPSELQTFEISDSAIEAQESLAVDHQSSLTSPAMIEAVIQSVQPVESVDPSVAETIAGVIGQSVAAGGGSSMGFAEMSLSGRTKENRTRLAKENGGSEESELAVELALAYLAEHQLNDGSWSMMYGMSCNGECEPSCSGKDPYRYAATGLALLCFLGAGKTPDDEQYGTLVSKGIYFLQQSLRTKSDSAYWVGTEASAQMYEHGIATLALCEAYQMTQAKELKDSCQLAINFIVLSQYKDGGWDYHPGTPGDLSIAGWQVMALKSAVAAKLVVPQQTIRGVDQFLDKTRSGEFMFKYRSAKPSKSMTAIGVLLQIFRSKSKDARAIEKGIEYLAKQEPSRSDMYYDYYATQAMFQYGGPLWKNWNYKMRDYLVRTQTPNGHMRGSWWFDDDHSNKIGGRFYGTCMACLILEVYYRYLPVYGADADEFRF